MTAIGRLKTNGQKEKDVREYTKATYAGTTHCTYDLQGRRVAKPTQNGIYVTKGKTMIIK